MLRRPMAAVLVLGLLFCGATVSLEAVGLLFHAGVPDPQQRVDAFVARLEADLSPVDLPTEPVELPREVGQNDVPGDDAERAAAVEAPWEGERPNERLSVAFSSPLPTPEPEASAQPDEAVAPEAPSESQEPASMPAPLLSESQEPASMPAPLLAVQAPSPTPEAAPPARRATGTRRATLERSPAGYAAFGWPVLDWLAL